MFDIRIICDPADEPDITRALTAAFHPDPTTLNRSADA